jgi:hypothetical protein
MHRTLPVQAQRIDELLIAVRAGRVADDVSRSGIGKK